MMPLPDRLRLPAFGQSRDVVHVSMVPRERVCLVTLADNDDARAHFEECREADGEANHTYGGRGDCFFRSIITYPELRGVSGVARVYVAWRNRILWWHQSDAVRPLELDDLRSMHPALAARMKPGDAYMWVFSEPNPEPAPRLIPDGEALRFGLRLMPPPGTARHIYLGRRGEQDVFASGEGESVHWF
jgi:hypothetical protein